MPLALDPVIHEFLGAAMVALAPVADPTLTVAERRERADRIGATLHQQVAEPGPSVGDVRDHTVDVAGGHIRLRCYRPAGTGPFAGHVVLHGGGWWQGSIDDWISDVQARERCAGSESVVVAVDYRLAPEHPFPTPLHDCAAAWRWVVANAEMLEIDRARLSLGGVSAGGNLAAALCLLLRDGGEPLPVLQLLEAPAVDFSFDHPSMRDYGAASGMDEDGAIPFVRMYLPDPADEQSPYASPLLAPDFRGLPPAHILTAEYDALRDAAELYADRLRAAGVPVTLTRHAGQVHTSPVMTAVYEGARAWRAEVVDALRRVAAAGETQPLAEATS
jgi:acetyl esterase